MKQPDTQNAAGQSGASNVVHLFGQNTSKFKENLERTQVPALTSRLLIADKFSAYHRMYEETKSPAILEAWLSDIALCRMGGANV